MKPWPTLTHVELAGFKSIRERTRMRVCPLTVLAGTNSSGKSSFIQPLLLLKQTFECSHDPGALLLDGPNLKARSFQELVSYGQAPEFFLQLDGITVDGVARCAWRFNRPNGEIQIAEQIAQTASLLDNREHVLRLGESVDLGPYPALAGTFPNSRFICARRKCLLGFRPENEALLPSDVIYSPGAWTNGVAEGLIHLPGLRGNPQREYPRTSVSDRFPGQFQDYVASLLAREQNVPFGLHKLDADLTLLGLNSSARAHAIGDTSYELRVKRTYEGTDFVNLADVGLGVSQALPVLVALAVAIPNQIVYIEQPEIHLHPRSQSLLATILVAAANRGVTVIAETHSSLLLRGIQTALARQEIAPDQVAMHWFSRDKRGWTTVVEAELDSRGRFGEWPSDFDDVALESESDFLNASLA